MFKFEPSPTCIAAISSELSLSKRGIGFQPRDFSMSPWKMIVTRQHPVTTFYMQHHTIHYPLPLQTWCRAWSSLQNLFMIGTGNLPDAISLSPCM